MTICQVVKTIASESDAKLPVVWGRLPKLARKWSLMILPNTWCCYGDWANKCTWNAWHIAQNRKRTRYMSVSDSPWMEVLPMCWGSRMDLWRSGWSCSCRKFQAEFFVTWWLLESIQKLRRLLENSSTSLSWVVLRDHLGFLEAGQNLPKGQIWKHSRPTWRRSGVGFFHVSGIRQWWQICISLKKVISSIRFWCFLWWFLILNFGKECPGF